MSSGDHAPPIVEQRDNELFDGAREIVADRFAEARVNPDGGLPRLEFTITD